MPRVTALSQILVETRSDESITLHGQVYNNENTPLITEAPCSPVTFATQFQPTLTPLCENDRLIEPVTVDYRLVDQWGRWTNVKGTTQSNHQGQIEINVNSELSAGSYSLVLTHNNIESRAKIEILSHNPASGVHLLDLDALVELNEGDATEIKNTLIIWQNFAKEKQIKLALCSQNQNYALYVERVAWLAQNGIEFILLPPSDTPVTLAPSQQINLTVVDLVRDLESQGIDVLTYIGDAPWVETSLNAMSWQNDFAWLTYSSSQEKTYQNLIEALPTNTTMPPQSNSDFERLAQKLKAPLAHNTVVEDTYTSNPALLKAMIDSIDNAKTSIILQNYYFDLHIQKDKDALLNALIGAQKRNVSVLVFADEISRSPYPTPYGFDFLSDEEIDFLKENGITIIFNPIQTTHPKDSSAHMYGGIRRHHEKGLCVDGRELFLTGAVFSNISFEENSPIQFSADHNPLEWGFGLKPYDDFGLKTKNTTLITSWLDALKHYWEISSVQSDEKSQTILETTLNSISAPEASSIQNLSNSSAFYVSQTGLDNGSVTENIFDYLFHRKGVTKVSIVNSFNPDPHFMLQMLDAVKQGIEVHWYVAASMRSQP